MNRATLAEVQRLRCYPSVTLLLEHHARRAAHLGRAQTLRRSSCNRWTTVSRAT